MRNVKRMIAMLVMVVMLVTVLPSSVGAVSYLDLNQSSTYYESVSFLSALNILTGFKEGDNYTFKPDDKVTRSQFAKIVVCTLGLEELAKTSDASAIFTDVKKEQWFTGYVKVAYDERIIDGMGDGTFNPEADVTYEQAVKMLVCALGYKATAISSGGWPDGYMSVANSQLLLTKNAVAPQKEAAIRGIISKLVYNSLKIKMAKPTMVSTTEGGQEEVSVPTKETILEDILKVTKISGKLTAAGEVRLNDASNVLRKDQIEIEGIVYDIGSVLTSGADAVKYVGYDVLAYYKQEAYSEVKELVMFDPQTVKNETFTVNDDLISNVATSGKVTYRLSANLKEENMTVNMLTSVIYNGKLWKASTLSDITNKISTLNGAITFLDSNSDGIAEVIYINHYTTYVVNSQPSSTDYIVADMYTPGKSVKLNPDDDSAVITIKDTTGRVIQSPTGFQKYNVISVATSDDTSGKRVYTVLLSTNTVTGAVTEIDRSSSPAKYTINGTAYKLNKEFAAYIETNPGMQLSFDSEGTFYLDAFGNIAAVSLAPAKESNYAILIAVSNDADDDDYYRAQIFDPNTNTTETYRINKKVKINNTVCTNRIEIIDELDNSPYLAQTREDGATNTSIAQPIKMVVNNKILDTIYTLGSYTEQAQTSSGSGLTLGLAYTNQVNYLSGNFDGKITIDSGTTVLYVPSDRADGPHYTKKSITTFRTNKKYNIEAFDKNASGIPKLLLVYGEASESQVIAENNIAIVKKVSTKETAGSTFTAIEVIMSGITSTIEAPDTTTFNGIVEGDVIRFGYNMEGKAVNPQIVLKAGSLPTDNTEQVLSEYGIPDSTKMIISQGTSAGQFGAEFRTFFGVASSVSETSITISPNEITGTDGVYTLGTTAEAMNFTVGSNAKIVVFDNLMAEGQKVRTETSHFTSTRDFATSTIDADKVLVHTKNGVVRTVYIIKLK